MADQSMSAKDWGTLVALSTIWSTSFLFNEIALLELPVFTIVFLRVLLGAVGLIALILIRREPVRLSLELCGWFAIMGLVNNMIPFSLIVWGQERIDSGVASILNATTPLFSLVLTHFFVAGERMTGARVVGVIAGVCGVAILIGPARLTTAFDHGIDAALWGHLALLGAAFGYGIGSVYGRRLKGTPPIVSAAGSMTAASLWLFPVAAWHDGLPLAWPSLTTIAAVCGLGLLCTSLAYILYFRLLASAGSVNAMLVTFLVPIGAILLGVLVLGEQPGPGVFVGMAVIFAGLATIDGRLFRRVRRAASR